MSIFDVLSLIGGLCLFLFGMNIMGAALERSAGSRLELILAKLTTGKMAGLLTGLAVTGVIQSFSATTVMVVGFVNSRHRSGAQPHAGHRNGAKRGSCSDRIARMSFPPFSRENCAYPGTGEFYRPLRG